MSRRTNCNYSHLLSKRALSFYPNSYWTDTLCCFFANFCGFKAKFSPSKIRHVNNFNFKKILTEKEAATFSHHHHHDPSFPCLFITLLFFPLNCIFLLLFLLLFRFLRLDSEISGYTQLGHFFHGHTPPFFVRPFLNVRTCKPPY